ncbi:MAG: family 43 glycosylhydrolase [Clostridia bacterium]|nr:family 43 glycosylhydrolase [Clostridia bacterium]
MNNAKNRYWFRRLVKMTGIAGLAVIALGLAAAAGCTKTNAPVENNMVKLARLDCRSPFVFVTDSCQTADAAADAEAFVSAVENYLNAKITRVSGSEPDKFGKYIFAFGSYDVPECASLMNSLQKNEYAIKVFQGNGELEKPEIIVAVAFNGGLARRAAISTLLYQCNMGIDVYDGSLSIPLNSDYKASVSADDLITTTDVSLRDPCILPDDGVYYMYGTGWKYFINNSRELDGPWEGPHPCVSEKPADSDSQYWAPEVHKYGDAYYMFTTYHKIDNDHRGCVIYRSETPEGPFEMWSDGHVTPSDWDCIDGTLYVDRSGQPWMVFVHEWTGTADNIGRMSIAKLSPDLKKLITEPKDIFMATDTTWATGTITDGPWLYTTKGGDLLMIWSNFDEAGYAVGIAKSSNGKIDGKWTQLDYQLYSNKFADSYDGGHGMIFCGINGGLFLSIHSPNGKTGERETLAVTVPLQEFGNMLFWDFGLVMNLRAADPG